MKKFNKLIFCVITFIFLHSCGSFSDAGKVLRNEKTLTTDEFLVKKREPLSLPPDYKDLPKPRTEESSKVTQDKNIDQILKIPKDKVKKGSSNVEQSIINQIRK